VHGDRCIRQEFTLVIALGAESYIVEGSEVDIIDDLTAAVERNIRKGGIEYCALIKLENAIVLHRNRNSESKSVVDEEFRC